MEVFRTSRFSKLFHQHLNTEHHWFGSLAELYARSILFMVQSSNLESYYSYVFFKKKRCFASRCHCIQMAYFDVHGLQNDFNRESSANMASNRLDDDTSIGTLVVIFANRIG